MSATVEVLLEAAAAAPLHRRSGTVMHTSGEMATARGINLRPHELAFIDDPAGRPIAVECAGSNGGEAYLAMLDRGTVIAGARVTAAGRTPSAPVGHSLLGRVLDGLGRPMDTDEPLRSVRWVPGHAEPPHPLDREPISASGIDTEAVGHITRATGLNLSGSLLDRFGEKLASDAAFAQVIRAANVYRGRLGYAPLGPDGWPEQGEAAL